MFDDRDLAFIKSGKYRIKVMRYLRENNVVTPNEISQSMNVILPQISRTLSELESKEIVLCTTPNRNKGRIYRLTEKGIKILDFLEDIEK